MARFRNSSCIGPVDRVVMYDAVRNAQTATPMKPQTIGNGRTHGSYSPDVTRPSSMPMCPPATAPSAMPIVIGVRMLAIENTATVAGKLVAASSPK